MISTGKNIEIFASLWNNWYTMFVPAGTDIIALL